MKKKGLIILAIVAAAAIGAFLLLNNNRASAPQPEVAKPTAATTETAVESKVPLQQIDTVTVFSEKMHRDINNIVVVPKAYLEPNDTTRYPTLYLLHGATDDYTGWSKHTDLGEIADTRRLIIVCPDGQDSWYFDSPIDSTMQFETYVSKELVDFIDKNYRTFANRQMRAITGLSMGGHGALWIAWRHPDVFASCGSMSGGVDITKFPDRWQLHKRLGRYAANKKVWEEHSVANLVPSLKDGQNIIISVGRQDFFYNVNLALHDSLTKRNIIHTFKTGKGNHSWDYWVKTLKDHLKFFDIAFEKNYTTQQQ